MKRACRVLFLVCIVCIFGGLISFRIVLNDATKKAVQLENVSLEISQVANGSYRGHSEIGPVIVDVEVMVLDGIIKEIALIQHQNGMGQDANVIIEDMVINNTYDVDAVTGATISSKVIINAVNDALKKGL